jgi:hypothetical protein
MSTLILRPNAAGDETLITSQYPNSTAHWDKVDEVTADDAATYVQSGYYIGSYQRDLYNLPNHDSESGVINSITITFRVRLNTDGKCKPSLKTGGTAYDGTEITTVALWTTYTQAWTTNPKTGIAWTWADIDGLQIGISLFAPASANVTFCTQLYVTVDYTPPSLTGASFLLRMI